LIKTLKNQINLNEILNEKHCFLNIYNANNK
jgi:hypothetical protein